MTVASYAAAKARSVEPICPVGQPNEAHIREHIAFLTDPARGRYDDALFEIAWDRGTEPREITDARKYRLDQIPEAVAWALRQNAIGCNMYIGTALLDPDADRTKGSTG